MFLIVKQEPKPYLADYVNPCWYESLDSDEPYSSNGYFGEDLPFHKQARPFLMKMHGLWRARKAVGLHTRLRCLPYFYVAGNPKCGSTDFYSNLIMHPKVTGGYTKETQWWVRFRIGECRLFIICFVNKFESPIFFADTPFSIWMER